MAKYRNDTIATFLEIGRALGDATRVRVLLALKRRELCVCQIVALFELAPSTLSKHLSVLRAAGLIAARKGGRWVYYRQADASADPAVGEAIDWAERSLANAPSVRADRARLREILKVDPDELCRLQAKRTT